MDIKDISYFKIEFVMIKENANNYKIKGFNEIQKVNIQMVFPMINHIFFTPRKSNNS